MISNGSGGKIKYATVRLLNERSIKLALGKIGTVPLISLFLRDSTWGKSEKRQRRERREKRGKKKRKEKTKEGERKRSRRRERIRGREKEGLREARERDQTWHFKKEGK